MNRMGSNSKRNTNRFLGRVMALEGILRSSFGRRETTAGRKSLARIRAAETPGETSNVRRVSVPAAEHAISSTFRPWYLRWPFFGGIAAAVMAFIGMHLIMDYQNTHIRLTEAVLGTIVNEPGVAYVVNDKGEITIKMGARIRPNDTIRVKEGIAKMQYTNETTIVDVMSDTDVKFMNENGAKHLDLPKGTIMCDVDPQPKDKPMVVTTPTAKAEIVGTSFKLLVSSSTSLNPSTPSVPSNPSPLSSLSTRLEVTKGLIEFTRLSDGKTVDVAGGQYATAAEGVELAALVIPKGPVSVPKAISSVSVPKSAAAPVGAGSYPKPRKHLYGKVLFEDDFENLDNWDVVIETGKDSVRFEPMGAGWEKYVKICSSNEQRRFPWQSGVLVNSSSMTVEDLFRMEHRDAILDRHIGLRSKRAIEAERFVIEIRSDLQGVGPVGTWWDSGIEAGEARSLAQNMSLRGWPTGDFGLLEFEPAKGQNPGTLLCQMFAVYRHESGGEHITWMESRYVYPVSRKIVLAEMNGWMAVDKVVVRELREEGK